MSNLLNELNNMINEIPEEIKDCFVIYVSKDMADELIKETLKFTNEKIKFPIYYKNIPVAIHEFDIIRLEVIKTKETVTKVYLYEKNKLDNYLKEYEILCKKYNIGLQGCGCCGSPFLWRLYTMDVENINYDNGKLEYDLIISDYYKPYLKVGEIE